MAVPISGTPSVTNMVETKWNRQIYKKWFRWHPWNYLLGVYQLVRMEIYTYSNINLTGSVGTGARNFQVRSVSGRHPSVSSIYDALLRYWDVSTTLTTVQASATFRTFH